jgi:hypothetical protein
MLASPTPIRETRVPEAADNKAHDRTDEIRSTRYPRLSGDQIEVLSRYGEIRKTEARESCSGRATPPTTSSSSSKAR